MNNKHWKSDRFVGYMILVIFMLGFNSFAEKVLYYSEKGGIMWVEKSRLETLKKREMKQVENKKKRHEASYELTTAGKRAKDHKTYYRVGLKYFFDNDYNEAFRYFKNAYKLKRDPKYYLFMAKCYRKLDKPGKMLHILNNILRFHKESDVADDALFEMALYYEMGHDYQKAIDKFRLLTEQYPYGTSIANHKEFRVVAREQITIMESEVDRLFKIAGITKGTLDTRLKWLQKKFKLQVTGSPDKKTMEILLKIQSRIEERKKKAAEQRHLRERIKKWSIAGLSALLVQMFWAFATTVGIKESRKRIEVMQKTLEQA